jgi:hypothetical protein
MKVIIRLVLAALALALLWTTGTTDRVLSQLGLKDDRCIENPVGAPFCSGGPDAVAQRVVGVVGASSSYGAELGQADGRSAATSAEAYRADHGSYVGMSTGILRQQYGLDASVVVVSATAAAYCMQATSGAETFSYRSPGGAVARGSC